MHLQTNNKNCNGCKFQIHWNNIEWLNSRNGGERKNPFCVSSKIYI